MLAIAAECVSFVAAINRQGGDCTGRGSHSSIIVQRTKASHSIV
jgi:hypothetical protein